MNKKKIIKNVSHGNKLIYNLTNYVSVNDIANLILLTNNSPIMSTQRSESEELTQISDSVCINIGTATNLDLEAMISAAKWANKKNKLLSLDPVGGGATKWRNYCVDSLLKNANFDIICCNISEFWYLNNKSCNTNGVDAKVELMVSEDNLENICKQIKKCAKKYQCIFVVHGQIDIISDGTTTYVVKNGSSLMSKVTGMGCMLHSFVNVFASNNPNNKIQSCALACSIFAKCGEIVANQDVAIGYFKNQLFCEIEKVLNLDDLNLEYDYESK